MNVEIVMPKMGESISEGTLIKWHKKLGEFVKKDEIIYEISTDKVDTEIPSPSDGVLLEIKVQENQTVGVGTIVAILETNEGSSNSIPNRVEEQSTTQIGGELIDIPMPKMGESIMEGTIIKWHKKVGDKINRDEIIFEISTDKVDTEVPSPVDGTLTEILVKENSTVAVGIAVARISTSSGIVKSVKTKEPVLKQDDNIQQSTIKIQDNLYPKQQSSNRFYSPLVLNIARTEGISLAELESIPGTGVNGRLSKNDLINYVQSRKMGSVASEKSDLSSDEKTIMPKSSSALRIEKITMDNNRQKIMQHMITSKNTSVHVSAMIEVDVSRIYNFIEMNRNKFSNEGIKLTYMPFISFAVIKGLKQFPLMNASLDGNNILVKNYINLGIAVAVEPNGLIVPNIKNADEKNIRGLAIAISDLGNRTRNKKLVPDDVTDGTFSITNYGVFGSLFGTPIINQPEVGILGVGAVTKKPVVVEINGADCIAIKPMMFLSLSHDHRLVDGMLGGKFLKAVKESLENFDTSII